jgi:hypothetical protein
LIKIKFIILNAGILLVFLICMPDRIFARDIPGITPQKSINSCAPKTDSSIIEKKELQTDNLNETDSFKTDVKLTDTISKRKEHYPQKATMYSAVLPGLGQAYNHKYWKIPIFYAGAGVLGYYIWFTNDQYKYYKQKYEQEVFKNSSDTRYRDAYGNARDTYRKWRDEDIVFLGILYVVNIIDAMADGYFKDFDVNNDLTLKIQPSIIPLPASTVNNYSLGLKLSFRF